RASAVLPLRHNLVEALRGNPTVELTVDHDCGRARAISKAVNRLEGEGAADCRLVELDTEPPLRVGFESPRVHRLTGLGATQMDCVTARRLVAKVMVETDYAVDFGTRQVQCLSYLRDRRGWHVAQRVLNSVKNRQQSAGLVFQFFNDACHRFTSLDVQSAHRQ